MEMKTEDVAWAAGFFEGEGNISFGQCGGVKINVQQINKEPLDKLARLFGGVIRGPITPKNPKARPYYSWNLSLNSEVNNFVWKLSPWLSEEKLSKSLNMIEFKINMAEYRVEYCRNGHIRSEGNKFIANNGKTRCRPCIAISDKKRYLRRKYGE